MERKVVTNEVLQAWLTAEIQKFEGCEECSFGGIKPLREADESGCNWSSDIVLRMTGVPQEIYIPAVSKIMREARKRFNIG